MRKSFTVLFGMLVMGVMYIILRVHNDQLVQIVIALSVAIIAARTWHSSPPKRLDALLRAYEVEKAAKRAAATPAAGGATAAGATRASNRTNLVIKTTMGLLAGAILAALVWFGINIMLPHPESSQVAIKMTMSWLLPALIVALGGVMGFMSGQK